MTEQKHTDRSDDDASDIDRALAETQRLERDERDAAIRRQLDADERVVRLLTEE